MDVVLFTVDALRFDCISHIQQTQFLERYGLTDELSTPTMDAIASKGLTFTQAVSTAPETPMAHASLFTGMYPPRHGIRSFFHRKLPQKIPTIFEMFKTNGFTTVGVADEVVFHDVLELTRGCDQVFDHDDSDQDLFDTIEQIKTKSSDLFLFHRFLDVHFPYLVTRNPPSNEYLKESYREAERICSKFDYEFHLGEEDISNISAHSRQWNDIRNKLRGKKAVDELLLPLYVKGISKFDKGRFEAYISVLEELGVLDDEYLLILTADHGEGLIKAEKTEDNTRRFNHSFANLDDIVRIPLIFASPSKISQSQLIDSQVSIVDILPTIVDLLDLSYPDNEATPQGTSIMPIIDGQMNSGSPAYSEYALWNDGRFDDRSVFKEMFSSHRDILAYEPLYRRRSIRTPNYRYVELGQDLSDEIKSKDPEPFVTELFRRVRATWTRDHEKEIDELTNRIKNNGVSRQVIIDQFLTDAILSNRYALFDLQTDPYEQINLLLLDHEQYKSTANTLKQDMACILEENRDTTDIYKDTMDGNEEQVLENLKDLGYL